MIEESHHPDKGVFLRHLEPEERFIGYFVLRSKTLEPFRDPTRGYYLTLVLSDRSGQSLAHVWENAEAVNQDVLQGDVVKVDGEVETYLERVQVRVLRLRPAAPEEYDIRDMLPSSKKNPDDLLTSIQFFIDQINDPHLTSLVNVFYGDDRFLRQFTQAPAGRRVHHAYLHDLLEHTVEVLTLANTLIDLYPDMNTDLLLCGALLHDIGKVREFDWGLDINYTDEGRLLGHVMIAEELVSRALQTLPDFPPELALQLRHMLLAHHGRYEWGSPRRPHTLEAIALHHLENLSAQVNRFQMLLETRPAGQVWTGYDRLLGRQLYAGEEDDLNIDERSWRE
jgi:3'-5' exoribonuclease